MPKLAIRIALVFVACLLVTATSVASDPRPSAPAQPRPPLDVRLPADETAQPDFVLRAPSETQLSAAASLRADVPGVVLRWDRMSGAPKWISAPPGDALSGPAEGDFETAARAFLRSRAQLLGL